MSDTNAIDIEIPEGGRASTEKLGNGMVRVTVRNAEDEVVRTADHVPDVQLRVDGQVLPAAGQPQVR